MGPGARGRPVAERRTAAEGGGRDGGEDGGEKLAPETAQRCHGEERGVPSVEGGVEGGTVDKGVAIGVGGGAGPEEALGMGVAGAGDLGDEQGHRGAFLDGGGVLACAAGARVAVRTEEKGFGGGDKGRVGGKGGRGLGGEKDAVLTSRAEGLVEVRDVEVRALVRRVGGVVGGLTDDAGYGVGVDSSVVPGRQNGGVARRVLRGGDGAVAEGVGCWLWAVY
eukprot:CAMPEP_0195613570 /NCGR_PEP_ID=MMETSP0815-20121206/11495_1 /TAXON_ID=97485 /ORGANISM="Prymnesium parvum, Strain Texoma1" /LENGTH=221 /DNA_ID=CAMNT_0040753799 /DNA_START=224 /DNA_END=887 /DNA_ORIENTATION=-